jgi:hypothetical protein
VTLHILFLIQINYNINKKFLIFDFVTQNYKIYPAPSIQQPKKKGVAMKRIMIVTIGTSKSKTRDILTVLARKALDGLWKIADLRGRTWGLKRNKTGNPFAGTNILIAISDELVSVSCPDGNELVVNEFVRTKNTKLGRMVKRKLRSCGLKVK